MDKGINGRIESRQDIMFGKPVIKGTRVPVDIILEKLAYGHTIDSILEDYPFLCKADILACSALCK